MFHDYDLPGLKTVDGVAELGDERSAWFSDSEGNIIAIAQSDAMHEPRTPDRVTTRRR